uniref:Purkinje cell protein 4 n=3 Tax=Hominidae TaxID=9604 RepID=F6SSA2_HUMAN
MSERQGAGATNGKDKTSGENVGCPILFLTHS